MATEDELVWAVHGLAEMDRVGRRLAEVLPDATTVALVGTLGAGKTRLVQAVAAALEIPAEQVTSPTFMLCQEYHGLRTLYHLDAYRVRDEDEFLELGPEEYFESPAITFVEWADRVERCLPPQRLEIRFEATSETDRQLTIRAIGDRYRSVLHTLRDRVGS